MDAVKQQCRVCIANFMQTVLPRLAGVSPADEVRVAVIGSGGDPESFQLDGIKVYAIPDYVYRKGDRLQIHDWKSGKVKTSHEAQLTLYGLWAREKHGVPPDRVDIWIEYLATGEVKPLTITEADLDDVRARIAASVAEMADYLVDGDLARNEPLPQEDWDLTLDFRSCRQCNFLELCRQDPAYPQTPPPDPA